MESKFDNSVQENKKVVPLVKRLVECSTGEKLKVLRVNAGHYAKRRLANLGILPGVSIIKRKAAPFRGPIEITVKGTLLVIGRGLAAKIIVISENSK